MEFLPFFLILLASVFFAQAFRRFHLPWVLALITAGIVIGPVGFELSKMTLDIEFLSGFIEMPLDLGFLSKFADMPPAMEFLSQIGLIFLMFMAGLETQFSSFKRLKYDIGWISSLNSLIPFLAGFGVGYLFDFSLVASLLLGIIFMSSSIAVIIPTLESLDFTHQKLGRTIIASTIIQDALSLVLLSMLLQSIDPITALPLPSFYIITAIIMVAFAYALPRLRALMPHHRDERDLFESEIRIILALLIGVVVTFELLGLHPIIAGFFAGLVLSESIKSKILLDKLRTISYGIFIPVFFVAVGMQTDITVFTNPSALGITLIILLASISTKAISGWLGARIIGFDQRDSWIVGFSTVPQLSTTLAVVFTAAAAGIVPTNLAAAMVAPIVVRYLAEHR